MSTLTQEEIIEIKSKEPLALLKIKKARVTLMQSQPFFSGVLLSMPIEFNHTWCSTAAIVYGEKQHKLVFNPEFITGIGEVRKKAVTQRIKDSLKAGVIDKEKANKQLQHLEDMYSPKCDLFNQFVVCHEVAHNVNEHFIRKGIRDANLYNQAADYVINLQIAKELIGSYEETKKKLPILEHLCFNPKYEGWTSEAVYADLEKEQEQGQKQEGETLDQHPDKQQQGSGSFEDHMGFDKPMPSVSSEEAKEANEKFQDVARSAAQAAQMAGNCPSSIAERYLTITPYKVRWERVLQKRIRSLFKEDTSYQRPSRRSFGLTKSLQRKGYINHSQNVVLPGSKNSEKVSVTLAVDTSGSLSKENLSKILSEMVGIERSCKGNLNISVFEWNSQSSGGQTYSGSKTRELKNWQPKTSGGTEIKCCIDYVREHYKDTKTVVIATDGYFFDKPDLTFGKEFDIIWLIQGNKDFSCEFGKILHLD